MSKFLTSRTAILIFANSSIEEKRHKYMRGSENLFDLLTQQTLATAQKSGLPYYLYNEKKQSGSSFGDRFTNAISDVFDNGYDRIITIGNDSPHLSTEHLLETAKNLANNTFVLGRSFDGGFYLMGLHRDQFSSEQFRGLAWQTSRLSNQMLALVSASADIYCLPYLHDIDSIDDIEPLLASIFPITEAILDLLYAILATINLEFDYNYLSLIHLHTSKQHNKGSPFLMQSA